jgi:hypothetical protein
MVPVGCHLGDCHCLMAAVLHTIAATLEKDHSDRLVGARIRLRDSLGVGEPLPEQ